VLDYVFERLTIWLSPLTSFTMEEAWQTRFPEAGSNSLRVIPETPAEWRNDAEAARWAKVETVMSVVTGALEVERREKRIGSALEAAPVVHVADADLLSAFDGLDAAEVFRTSSATWSAGDGGAFTTDEVKGVSVDPALAEGRKCARSWRILPEVGTDPRYPELSLRDAEAVAYWDANARKLCFLLPLREKVSRQRRMRGCARDRSAPSSDLLRRPPSPAGGEGRGFQSDRH
jgi:isoleucyl-tRNA synthetase